MNCTLKYALTGTVRVQTAGTSFPHKPMMHFPSISDFPSFQNFFLIVNSEFEFPLISLKRYISPYFWKFIIPLLW